MNKFKVMVYEQRAVYEPAEGGYYVPETYLDRESDTGTMPEALELMERTYQELLTENEPERVWIAEDKTMIIVRGKYIGEDEIYKIEPEDSTGEECRTYEGYC